MPGGYSVIVRRARVGLVGLSLVDFLVVFDGLAVAVALPSIADELRFSRAGLQWVVSAYALTFGGLLLLGGRLGDLFGRRRVLIAGLIGFVLASLFGGSAQTSDALVAARALQGASAAACAPSALALLASMFAEGRERSVAMTVWSAISSVAVVAGVLLGGVVTAGLGWRWILFGNLPVALAAIVLLLAAVPVERRVVETRAFDLAGAATATVGVAFLVYGTVALEQHSAARASSAFAVAAALLVAFVLVEHRAYEPLLPLDIVRQPPLLAANVGAFVLNGGFAAVLFLTTLYLQRVLGYSAIEAGLAFLPLALGTIAGSSVAGWLVGRYCGRRVAFAGLAATAGGLLLLAPTPEGGTYLTDVLPGIALVGVGVSCAYVPLTLGAVAGVSDAQQGIASGLYHATGQIGGAVILAALATVAAASSDGSSDFTLALVLGAVVVAGGALASAALASRRVGAPGTRPIDCGREAR
jgi:EmrB/QacA subfamily drug resistance transporter